MNYGDAMLPPVHGLVDPEGRLVEADQRLDELNAQIEAALAEFGRPREASAAASDGKRLRRAA